MPLRVLRRVRLRVALWASRLGASLGLPVKEAYTALHSGSRQEYYSSILGFYAALGFPSRVL